MLTSDKNKLLIAAGVVGLAYFGVLNPLLKWIGIKDDKDTTDLNNAASNPQSFWSPLFWKQVYNPVIMTRASAENICRIIYDAMGVFNDNEEQAIGALKALKYQAQVSFLAEVFFSLYGMDLITFLRGGSWPMDRLSDTDVADLNSYISKLPVS